MKVIVFIQSEDIAEIIKKHILKHKGDNEVQIIKDKSMVLK